MTLHQLIFTQRHPQADDFDSLFMATVAPEKPLRPSVDFDMRLAYRIGLTAAPKPDPIASWGWIGGLVAAVVMLALYIIRTGFDSANAAFQMPEQVMTIAGQVIGRIAFLFGELIAFSGITPVEVVGIGMAAVFVIGTLTLLSMSNSLVKA